MCYGSQGKVYEDREEQTEVYLGEKFNQHIGGSVKTGFSWQ